MHGKLSIFQLHLVDHLFGALDGVQDARRHSCIERREGGVKRLVASKQAALVRAKCDGDSDS